MHSPLVNLNVPAMTTIRARRGPRGTLLAGSQQHGAGDGQILPLKPRQLCAILGYVMIVPSSVSRCQNDPNSSEVARRS